MYKQYFEKTIDGNKENSVIRIADNVFVPFDPNNTDYQSYLMWLDGYELIGRDWVKTSDSNTPLPADE